MSFSTSRRLCCPFPTPLGTFPGPQRSFEPRSHQSSLPPQTEGGRHSGAGSGRWNKEHLAQAVFCKRKYLEFQAARGTR